MENNKPNKTKRKAEDEPEREKIDKMPKTGHSPPPRTRRNSVGEAPITENTLKSMLDGLEKRLGLRFEGELKQNQDEIKEVRQLLGDTETKLLERMDGQKRQLEAMINTAGTSGASATSSGGISPKKEESYWTHRKSLSVWPIIGDDLATGLRIFLNDKLKLGDDQIRELGHIKFKRMKEPASKAKKEVLCTFETKEARDLVKAASKNLAGHEGDIGLRAQYPGFLVDTFRTFETIAFHLRSGDPNVRRSVKFDDAAMDLVMDIKLGDEWRRILPAEAKKTLEENPHIKRGPEEISSLSLSQLLAKNKNKTPATGANSQPMP